MGARGSGKTTVGRALSLRLDFPFVDLDDVVLARFEEASVTEVWKHRGEAAWRRAEAEMLESTLKPLLATSGDHQVVITCNDQVSHGRFVNVLDRTKQCGARKIAVKE